VQRPPLREGDRSVGIAGSERTYANEARDFAYNSNSVITSRYTFYNAIPKNLYEQFQNPANVYFFMIGLLQTWKAVSTTGGWPSMYQPLFFIVCVSALRAFSEDRVRHNEDAKRNGYKYDVYENGKWTPTKSGDLKVGHLVKILENEMIPCDIVLVGSALEKGHCFIDKANLNGETTLEVMTSILETRKYTKNDGARLSEMRAEMDFEAPNDRFDALRGHLSISSSSKEVSLDGKVLAMRETNLRNCAYIIGIVVYNGNETKIQMSSNAGDVAKVKVSRIMQMVNKYLVGMVTFQVRFVMQH
jgi:magnesium-transporting ATPase (P-type)